MIFFKRVVRMALRMMPVVFFTRVFGYLLQVRVEKEDAKKQMVALLNLQSRVDHLLANAATQMGHGSHVKHRLTNYHDFFVNQLAKNERVLDVGCGGGELSMDMAERSAAHITGIDICKLNIQRARDNNSKNVTWIYGDATTHDFSTERFDTLVLSNVLEHIEHRPDFLKRIFLQTKAGRALIRVPVFERDWTVPMRRELGLEWRLDTTHFTEYTVPEFEHEMQAAGVTIENMVVRWSEIWAQVKPISVASL